MAKTKLKKSISHDEQLQQIAQLEAQWKRALADYQNLEKRTQLEKQQFVKLANMSLIARLLPIMDDLDRANRHLADQGLELVQKQLWQVLQEEGLIEIPALNQPFDPNKMECVEQTEGEPNIVSRVDVKGYMVDDLVIRTAKVAVGIKNS